MLTPVYTSRVSARSGRGGSGGGCVRLASGPQGTRWGEAGDDDYGFAMRVSKHTTLYHGAIGLAAGVGVICEEALRGGLGLEGEIVVGVLRDVLSEALEDRGGVVEVR